MDSTLPDRNSFSRPDLAIVTNIFICWDINFDNKILTGHVELTIQKVDESTNEIVLDSKDLKIDSIYDTELNKKLNYTLTDGIEEFGSKLTVELPQKETNKYLISIKYETSPKSSGLQWVETDQTHGKTQPFVFSQFQTIHARSALPCQDTPLVKTKYSAVISSPSNATVVMSAICNYQQSFLDRTLYHFKQDVPVPSYLIALAAGDLESKKIGPRSKVWAERKVLETAAFDFSETERQLAIAEGICGPYAWGVYDILVLPPSFPFGGTEHPCLTFASPTLLSGDKSMTITIAHEIAHSWSGNLVTCATFEHLWLNEGITTFIELKILGKQNSSEFEDFCAYGGFLELKEAVGKLNEDDTRLILDFKGSHPDDAFTLVPYEKGYIFMRFLQDLVGVNEIDGFLKEYFNNFKYKSITSDDFKDFFVKHFENNSEIKSIDWNEWFHGKGMPKVTLNYDLTLLNVCKELTKRFLLWDGTGNLPIAEGEVNWLLPQQIVQILQELFDGDSQRVDKLKAFEILFHLNDLKSCEIRFRWFRVAIKARWEDKIGPAIEWLNQTGRMRYARPLYADLYRWDKSKDVIMENYQKNKKFMMFLGWYTIGKDLGLI